MELLRRLGCPDTLFTFPQKPESSEADVKLWEQAFLGEDPIWQCKLYTTLLTLRDDPSKKVYSLLTISPQQVMVDTPLRNHTPQEELAQRAYSEATFLGEIDPEKYRAFAVDMYIRDQLVALMNRKTAGVDPKDVSRWFYTSFGVEHLKRYGAIYIGSHGGLGEYGHDFNATIESPDRSNDAINMTEQTAADFSQVIRGSLPWVNVDPLPVDKYLRDVQSALKCLPRDWEV